MTDTNDTRNDGTKREPDPLDGYKPNIDVFASSLKPQDKRLLVRGMLADAAERVGNLQRACKDGGVPFAADIQVAANLLAQATELSRTFSLDFANKDAA